MRTRTLEVRPDPALTARLVRCTPLHYSAGPDAGEDRPAVVRAGSALRFLGGKLAVVQDDACFLAMVGEDAVVPLPLPRGAGGRRRFESRLGNKAEKLDLEAAIVLGGPSGERIVAFGSGSTDRRERIVVAGEDGAVRIVDGSSLYAMLRANEAFAGSELNVEGAIATGDRLALFQRANGAPARGLAPTNAVMELRLDAFVAWLDGFGSLPEPLDVTRYDLGDVDGVRFGFTDAAPLGDGRAMFVAGAERSPNTYDDGEVVGCRVGVLEAGGGRCTDLLDASGAPSRLKVEGITLASDGARRIFAVTDQDSPDEPALLCEIVLDGPW